MHPDDIPRFRELGVAANMQSLWAALEPQMVELTLPFLGDAARRMAVPVRRPAARRRGARGGQRLVGLHARPARGDPRRREPQAAPGYEEGDYDAFLPEQAIDLATSLTAYTAGSAWVNHLDDVTGTIEVGKYADLAVLDRDPFAGPRRRDRRDPRAADLRRGRARVRRPRRLTLVREITPCSPGHPPAARPARDLASSG